MRASASGCCKRMGNSLPLYIDRHRKVLAIASGAFLLILLIIIIVAMACRLPTFDVSAAIALHCSLA